jgi:hypothetical protein
MLLVLVEATQLKRPMLLIFYRATISVAVLRLLAITLH